MTGILHKLVELFFLLDDAEFSDHDQETFRLHLRNTVWNSLNHARVSKYPTNPIVDANLTAILRRGNGR